MNIKLATVLGFAGGVVTGALVMWRGAGSHFRQVADEEIEEMRVFYSNMAEEAVEKYKEDVESDWERIEAERAEKGLSNEIVDGPNGWSYKDDPTLTPEDEVDATTAEAAKALIDYQGGDPFPEPDYTILLTQREFEEGPPDDYDQVTLTYYALDGILTTQDDKQLEVKKAIGDLDPAWFGEKSDFPDVCYVRNTRMKIDFEVVRSLESFGKTVLGLGDDSG